MISGAYERAGWMTTRTALTHRQAVRVELSLLQLSRVTDTILSSTVRFACLNVSLGAAAACAPPNERVEDDAESGTAHARSAAVGVAHLCATPTLPGR